MRVSYQLVRLWDLPDKIRICFKKSFTEKLFKLLLKKYKTQKSLAIDLDADPRIIGYWWHKNGPIPLNILRKMIEILARNKTYISLEEIEQNVIAIGATGRRKGSRGMGVKSISFKLPIVVNEDVTRITELIRTDGSVRSNLTRMRFKNKDYSLIKEFENCATKAFGEVVTTLPSNKDTWEVNLGGTALTVLLSKVFEIPPGNKCRLIKIPEMIKKSPLSVKRVAIRSYFDAEGTVSKDLFMIRLRSDSVQFLNDIKSMLLKFRIKSRLDKDRKNLIITHKDNITKFYEKIGLSQIEKKERLENLITRYKNMRYYTKEEVTQKIIQMLRNSNKKWIYSKELEAELDRKNPTVFQYIKNLVKEGKIKKKLVREGKVTRYMISLINE